MLVWSGMDFRRCAGKVCFMQGNSAILLCISWFWKVLSMQVLLDKYEITSVYGEFQILEHMFTELIFDEKQLIESAAFRGGDKETCISNIKKLMSWWIVILKNKKEDRIGKDNADKK